MLTLQPDIWAVLVLALASASLALTLTKSLLFSEWRLAVFPVPILGKLLTCPWCALHWIFPILYLLTGVRATSRPGVFWIGIELLAGIGISTVFAAITYLTVAWFES